MYRYLRLFSKSWLSVIALFSATTLLVSCITTSDTSSSQNFTPDYTTVSTANSGLSPEQNARQMELEGYVARTSSRSMMRLPKDLDLTLSGALRKSTRVEFIEPEVEYQSHLYPYRMTDYTSTIHYRPVFNDRFNASGSVR
ncbi:hypothetical protein AZI86_11790 [Bdellovibrio bacteriovorus]|uniref:Lipoprotein n=1 Tax=Bdellovibrio bacteriovorus TaxID=959 RepID=A0A150WLU2_BDEBC|nr:hypothetical protein [Bdellovibrio bacteriovorus]KYG64876.1 hypothetical protein AZI86_11790 [Bdellovibrio bacteriovorus]